MHVAIEASASASGRNAMKAGLIGMGRWGRRLYATMLEMPQITVSAVASGNPETPGLIAATTAAFTDWQQMIDEVALDAVVIATPPSKHTEMTVRALSKGLAVMLEKPMATNSREAEFIREAVISARRPFMVGHIHLRSAAYEKLKLCAGKIGPIREIIGVGGGWGPFRPDYRSLWDYGPHDVSMTISLTERNPTAVSRHIREMQTSILLTY